RARRRCAAPGSTRRSSAHGRGRGLSSRGGGSCALLGVLHAGHLAERRDEPAPVFALIGEDAASGLGDAVVTAPALPGLLDPASLDPAAVFEAVEGRIE